MNATPHTRPDNSFLIACHGCDLLHRIEPMEEGTIARCGRCGAILHRQKKNSAHRTMAMVLTGIILFIIANIYPFLGFRIGAQISSSTLITGVIELFRQGLWLLSALVLATTILMPAFQLAGTFYVLLPYFSGVVPPHHKTVFRWVIRSLPWSMTEVFFLGILVALVKLSNMATILPGTALYAFMALMVVLAATTMFIDPHLIWDMKEKSP